MRVRSLAKTTAPRAKAHRPRSTPAFRLDEGYIEGTAKDGQSVQRDWLPAQHLLQGVKIVEVRNVIKGGGMLTEVFRREWNVDEAAVDQVFQVLLGPREVSAWHVHRDTRDRLFVNHGAVRVVLYDARRASSTFGGINEFRLGAQRPALVLVPPGVWHGLENLRDQDSLVLNLVDRAYCYEDPDHWRLPADSASIPYRFAGASRRAALSGG